MSTAPTTTQPPPARTPRRVYIPLVLLAIFLLVAVGFFIRGTWADTQERDPSSIADSPVVQLLRKPNGNVVVRGAIRIDARPTEVWSVVTGYDQHSKFLPYISKVEATPRNDGRIKVAGVAHSRIWGDWPFDALTLHDASPADGLFTASWSEDNVDDFEVNRGAWGVKPIDRNQSQSLLTLTLQIELKKYPNFIVRNVLMDRLPSVLTAMRDETLRRKGG